MTEDTRASLELLYNVSRQLTSALDLHTVLTRVLFLSTINVKAERGSVIVMDEDQKPVDAAVIYEGQLVSHTIAQVQATLEQGLAGWVVRNRQPAMVEDTSTDMRWLHRTYEKDQESQPKSAICVPIMVRDELIGVLTLVHRMPNFFRAGHLSLLQAIADQAGIAIHNARLFETLQATHRRYRELFEDSIDAIILTNLEGQIVETNRQAVNFSGRTAETLQGASIWELYNGGPQWMEENMAVLQAGDTVHCEAELFPLNKPPVPIELHVHKITFGREELLQWLIRDISERKQLDSLRDDLSAMIYHDLRSPLANIVSSLDMMHTITTDEENPIIQQVLVIAIRSTERLQRLINSLLDINRLEAGQPITNRHAVDIMPMIHEAMDAISPTTSTKNQQVHIDIGSDLPKIWADEDIIRRVLINLVENATKFTPLGGDITIGARRENDSVRMWVKDSGPGIPIESQKIIFNKYSRIPADRAPSERVPRGLGLGLAFCKLAVQAHGGEIDVESEPGKGSCFYFTVPSAKQTE